jgi:hypothetical protein
LSDPHAGQAAHDQGCQSKKKNIEASWGDHLDAEQHETEKHPIPPDHRGASFTVRKSCEAWDIAMKV